MQALLKCEVNFNSLPNKLLFLLRHKTFGNTVERDENAPFPTLFSTLFKGLSTTFIKF